MSRIFYNVSPRYTPGSPAMVPQETAERVALEEIDFHRITLTGVFGEERAARARAEGLEGIVEARREHGQGWDIFDLCTHRHYFRPFQEHHRRGRVR